jgi:hypothetical protein
MKFCGWVYDIKASAWQRICVSSSKNQCQNFVSALLDEKRLSENLGLVLVAGREPCHTPAGVLKPSRTIREYERGQDAYTMGEKQK